MADNKKDSNKDKKKSTSNNKSKSNKKQSQNKMNQQNQFWAIMLFALGILLLFISIVEGTDGWKVMHDTCRGIFGLSVFLYP